MHKLISFLAVLLPALTNPAHAAAFIDQVGVVDKLLVFGGVVIVVLVTVYCVKCFLHPGEYQTRHIKRRILVDDW